MSGPTRPDDAFETLGHEIRFEIVAVLGEAGPLSFSDLHDRVDVRDSGQFNYHLDHVVGTFVEQGDAGYDLTVAGKRVYGAVLAESFTGSLDGPPVEMEATCYECESQLETRFEADRVGVVCSSCESVVTRPEIPAGVFAGWDNESAPEVIARWNASRSFTASVGLCPRCDGRVDRTAVLPGESAAPDWFDGSEWAETVVVARCQRCDRSTHAIPSAAVVHHPNVAAFHLDHGTDVRTTPFWNLDWMDRAVADLVARDPLRFAVPVTLEDDRRVFLFDRDVSLVGAYDA